MVALELKKPNLQKSIFFTLALGSSLICFIGPFIEFRLLRDASDLERFTAVFRVSIAPAMGATAPAVDDEATGEEEL